MEQRLQFLQLKNMGDINHQEISETQEVKTEWRVDKDMTVQRDIANRKSTQVKQPAEGPAWATDCGLNSEGHIVEMIGVLKLMKRVP